MLLDNLIAQWQRIWPPCWLSVYWLRFRPGASLRAAHLKAGDWAETWAECYLRRQGLRVQARRYLCRRGEIDLIMLHDAVLVFVEVRYRQAGGALESINSQKQQHILRCALRYLQTQRGAAYRNCRFDVVTIEGSQTAPVVDWIKDAFRPPAPK